MSEETVAEDQIAAFVDRILRLKAEADDIAADIKEIYAEAHGNGFNKTRLGEVVTYLRKVEKDASGVAEAEVVRDLYLTGYYRAKNKPHTHAYARGAKSAPNSTTQNASVSEAFDPKTGEVVTTQDLTIGNADSHSEPRDPAPDSAQMPSVEAADLPADNGTATSAAGREGIVDRQPIQPETAEPVPSIEGVKAPMMVANDANTGGENEEVTDALIIETETADAKSSGLVIENTMKRDGASEASVSSVEIAAPLYAEPGIIVMETVPPVGIVAHPYAACWPVNIIDVTGGVREPIVKIGHLILDGRGRYFAARAATMEYPVVQYDGDDALADSIRWNMESRIMSEAALRMVAQKLAKAAPDRADEILERMGLAEDRQAAE